ncbi:MAG: hypothetical protein KDH09_14185 [Chrysiogenetes bacterium]|nr:hypothetical protein [Chrysiogenetes bacterium]
MKFLQSFSAPALLLALVLGIAGCGNEGDVLLFLDFAETNAPGSSQVKAINVTSSDGAGGVVNVPLEVTASAGFDGQVDFRAVLDDEIFDITGMSDPASGVFFSLNNPAATTNEAPFEILPGEMLSFYAVINVANGSGDCGLHTVRVATIPDADFVDIHLQVCPPSS